MIHEFGSPDRVLVNAKEHSTVVMLDPRRVFVFDRAGRLLYASKDGALLRRGMDGRMLRIAGPAGEDAEDEEEAYRLVAMSCAEAPPEARARLDEILRCDAPTRERDARRFRELYGSVPVLPPDQYDSIYLQLAVGCATNRCTFCTLYRDRAFRVRSPEEFGAHLADVAALLGADLPRRRSVFLGDANAAGLPMRVLRPALEGIRRAFPGLPLSVFADATLRRVKSPDQLRELRGLGLGRVTFGLETALPALYDTLRKPGTLASLLAAVRAAKEARIAVGITVLVGLGGGEFADDHLYETERFLRKCGLGPGDFVYLSPIRVAPDSEYASWTRADPARTMSPAAVREQMTAFRERLAPVDRSHAGPVGPFQRWSNGAGLPGLAAVSRGEGVRVVPYDLSRFIY